MYRNLKLKFLWMVGSLIVFLSACEPETPQIQPPLGVANKTLVLCEGNFMWGNAQLDVIDIDSMTLQSNVFERVNNKPVGDVLQSALHWGHYVYLVVNNSGKVMKLEDKSLKLVVSEAGLGSPRYLLPVENRLWLTDLYSGKISILDTATLKKVGEIAAQGWTETMAKWGDVIAVSSYNKGAYLFNQDGTPATQSKLIGDSTTKFGLVDDQNRLWLASTGGSGFSTLKRFDTPLSAYPKVTIIPPDPISQLISNKLGDTLYFTSGNKVWSISSQATRMDEAVLLASGFQQLYGMNLSSNGRYLLLADAKDYVSNGRVSVMDLRTKTVVKVLETGVNPNGFLSY